MKLRIAILGTRGIPNYYGGFEHISQHLAKGLVKKGHHISVYNSHRHPHQEKKWQDVTIIHCYDPEYKIGTAGQFIYDFNCLMHARKMHYDILLFMGYTSSSIWGALYPKNSIIITNMDGLEWKRSKYNKITQNFLKYAEKLAIKYSQFHIADSTAIQSYLKDKYRIESEFIPYGADLIQNQQEKDKPAYYLLMARMEPENNIEMILDGFSQSNSQKQFKVLGNIQNNFGKFIAKKFKNDSRIQFLGANFDTQIVNSLQHHSFLYFHGHSVGGTNPSLLQAMANGAVIAAHQNPFNKAVLQDNGFYFNNANEVKQLIETVKKDDSTLKFVTNNYSSIETQYNWEKIINEYERFMLECYTNK
jgi:glycosyltransferase involved in cell wall biosynthesis